MRDINQYSKEYAQAVFEEYQVKFRRKKILEILKQYSPARILEIGCGMEPLFSYINWPFENYTVVEPSVTFIENAKNLAKDQNIYFINDGFAATEDIKKSGFNFIVCSSLLHEIEDPASFLKQIAAACIRETIVHINVPNANSMHRLLALEMGIINDVHNMSEQNKIMQQNFVFDQFSLCEMVIQAGFKILDKGSFFVKPFTHQQMHLMMKKGILTQEVLEGLYKMTKHMPELGSEIYVNCKIETN